MPNVVILGSTGSIGTQTLAVLRNLPEFRVLGLAAGSNAALLREQIAEFRPQCAALAAPEQAAALSREFSIPVYSGSQGLVEMAADHRADLVVAALVGALGLEPTLTALQAGKRVALANKETLVIGGPLVMEYREQIVPIDSEHSAIWSLLQGRDPRQVSGIILTASGGPFRTYEGSLDTVSVEQALAHPNWRMGGKISIDSATLMNKGLEVIEAHWLFERPYEQIEVVVHPQSVVHSLIRLQDGSVLGQLAVADMRLPIQYALTYPEVVPALVPALDLLSLGPLTFEAVDRRRFPCLDLAYEAGRAGGAAPIALNAANEVAVHAFLQGALSFTGIPRVVEAVLGEFQGKSYLTLPQILMVDRAARIRAHELTGPGGWTSC